METVICRNCGDEIEQGKNGVWVHKNTETEGVYCEITAADPLELS